MKNLQLSPTKLCLNLRSDQIIQLAKGSGVLALHTNREELELERLLLAPVAARANLENDSPHDKKYAFFGDEK